jgi:hypothetical protein
MSATIETIKAKSAAAEALAAKLKKQFDTKNEEFKKDLESIRKAKESLLEENRNFQRLRLQALSFYSEKTKKGLTQEEITRESRNYFLSSGLDYKGQNQSCYQADGIQARTDASFDFGRLLSGIFSAQVSANATAAALLKQILIAHVGPSRINNFIVPEPIIINLCEGVLFQGELGAGVFAGVAVETGIDLGLTLGNVDLSVNASISASAGVTGNVSINGNYFYAEDTICKSFEQPSGDDKNLSLVRQELDKLLDFKILTEKIKTSAGNLFLHRLKPTIITNILISSTNGKTDWAFTAQANAGVKCAVVNASIDATANAMAGGSRKDVNIRFQTVYKPSPESSISKQQEDEKRIKAAIKEYEDGLGGFFRSQSLESKEALAYLKSIPSNKQVTAVNDMLGLSTTNSTSTSIRLKPTSTFYGLLYHALQQAFIVMTQDSKIIYQQYEYDANAKLGAKVGKSEILDLGTSKSYYYNRLSYKTITVFWGSENKRHSYFQASTTKKNEDPETFTTPALNGSGISYGGSFALVDLKEALQFNTAELWMITPNVPDESHDQFPLEDLGSFRTINDDIPNEKHEMFYKDKINPTAMTNEIKHALEAFDIYLKSTWFAGKPHAAKILKDMIDKKESVGPAVAWLINKNDKDDKDNGKYNSLFHGKHSTYKINHTATKIMFFDLLTTAYKEGLHGERLEKEQNENEAIKFKNLQTEQEKWNQNIQYLNAKKLEDEKSNLSLKDKIDKQIEDQKEKLRAQKESNERIRNIRGRNELNELINEDVIRINKMKAHNIEYLKSIAVTLNVTVEQLYAFFGKNPNGETAYDSRKCLGMILDHEIAFPGLGAIIIEASFKYEPDVILKCSLIKPSIWKRLSTYWSPLKTNEEIIELSPDTAKNMLDKFNGLGKHEQYKRLNAIRLRFRIQDMHNDEKTLFKLGFKILGTGAKIELKGLEQAGSEGIVDLHTAWFDKEGAIIENKFQGVQEYDTGVPQVTLFSQ